MKRLLVGIFVIVSYFAHFVVGAGADQSCYTGCPGQVVQISPPLAQTGAPIDALTIAGFGLVGVGSGVILVSRKRAAR